MKTLGGGDVRAVAAVTFDVFDSIDSERQHYGLTPTTRYKLAALDTTT
jgi:hypothetical protein